VPIVERDDTLYLSGGGRLHVRDTLGRDVPGKGKVLEGAFPRGVPEPALILPGAAFSKTIDLAKYFEMGREGRYIVTLLLDTPDGRGLLKSNEVSLRVAPAGSVSIPRFPVVRRTADTSNATSEPRETDYKPGRVTAGLCGLLRPTKRRFRVGEPILMELRLTNVDRPMLNIDTRLERSLTIRVREKDGAAPVRVVRQVISWPQDKSDEFAARRMPVAWLPKDAFWGKVLNINSLYGVNPADVEPPSAEEIAGSGPFGYEKYGKTLFSFERPGKYEIAAVYSLPRSPRGEPRGEHLWTGTVITNTVVIEVESGP